MDIKTVLLKNYMPYAKGTIISRAIPYIDGLKPANRRILYTMYKLGLINGDKKKSSMIVGRVMAYHPHGDATIYDTMVHMATGNESLNVPYIESKGNFGKVWSKNMAYAAPRYTEAKLSSICNDVFDGINEDAVDMIDNFDNTEKEPVLLPIKFPSILVNTSSGIAVGCSSNIAPFNLKDICEGTIAILEGRVSNARELMEVVGMPDFSTGGCICKNEKELYRLFDTGRGTFTVAGSGGYSNGKLNITNVPYRVDVETLVNDIRERMKTDLKEVVSVKDLSDIKGLNLQVSLKRGTDINKLIRKLYRYTKLKTSITFNNSVIIDNRCKTVGVYQLLLEWIQFRLNCIKRVYTFRKQKKEIQVHLLKAWGLIEKDINDVVNILTSYPEDKAIKVLGEKYGLDEKQAEYFLDMKIKYITKNRLLEKLKDLEIAQQELALYTDIVENESSRQKIIIEELKTIINKCGAERKTVVMDEIVEEASEIEKKEPEDCIVTVVVTKSFCIKKFKRIEDAVSFKALETDPVIARFVCNNKEDILVYTTNGLCYKIKVDNIDGSRGLPKEYIFELVNREQDDKSDILYITPAGDYSGHLNIVYSNGKGVRIPFNKVSGNRSKYRSQFDISQGKVWATMDDKFFIVTNKGKAAFIDTSYTGFEGTKSSFRVCRLHNENILGVVTSSSIPDFDSIDTSKYTKGYTVKIKGKYEKK